MIGVTADTNIYVSALEFGGLPLQLLTAARQSLIRLDISNALLTEIRRVLRDKFSWTEDMLQRETYRLSRFTSLAHPTRTIDAVPNDPDDNRVLECAVAAGSQYIVTGDSDLLQLGAYESIRILRVADFMRLINP